MRGAGHVVREIVNQNSVPKRRPKVALLLILAFIVVGAGLWYVLKPAPLEQVTPGANIAAPDTEVSVPANERTLPSFDVVRVTRGGTGVIAGRAEPHAEIEILANGQTLGKATADDRGDWVLIFDTPLAGGGHELELMAHSAGKEPVRSAQVVVVVVPKRADENFIDSAGEGVIAVMTPRDGKGPSTILQRPNGTPDTNGGLALETVDYDESGHATFGGRAGSKAGVRLYLDNVFLGQAQADDGGHWSFTPAAPIVAGDHLLRLDQVLADGEVQLRSEIPFNREQALDPSRATGSIVIQPGNNLWQIARRLYGAGFHYTIIFSANRDQIVDPDLIYPGQVFAVPKTGGESQ